MNDLVFKSARKLATLLRTRKASAVEVTKAFIAQVADYGTALRSARAGLRSADPRAILASQGRLDPHVTLLDKPFTETELLTKVGAALAVQPSASRA